MSDHGAESSSSDCEEFSQLELKQLRVLFTDTMQNVQDLSAQLSQLGRTFEEINSRADCRRTNTAQPNTAQPNTAQPNTAQPNNINQNASVPATTTSDPPWQAGGRIGFFSPELPLSYGVGLSVSYGNLIYYRSVHLFVETVQRSVGYYGEQLVKRNLHKCLHGTALSWYVSELSDLDRSNLRCNSLDDWITRLENRFMPPPALSIPRLVNDVFSLDDLRCWKDPVAFVEDVIDHAKDASINDTFQQLSWAWINFCSELRADITAPGPRTTIEQFKRAIELRKHMWRALYGCPIPGMPMQQPQT